jgi:hypothetical protein
MTTHPLFADFRAAQEGRNPKDIGLEITGSLEIILELSQLPNAIISTYLFVVLQHVLESRQLIACLLTPTLMGGKHTTPLALNSMQALTLIIVTNNHIFRHNLPVK